MGIPTVCIVLLRDITAAVRPPRALVVPFRHGYPLGAPRDPALQRHVIESALRLLEMRDVTPPLIVDDEPSEAVQHLNPRCVFSRKLRAGMSINGTPIRASRYRALVVEDDPAIRRLVEKLLARHNIAIEAAADGKEAIRKIREQRFSVIVLDLMVPEINGFQVIDFLKSERVSTPVAVVSAVSQQALTNLDLDIVKLVISKPFDVDEFTRAVLALCAEAEQNAQETIDGGAHDGA